MIILYCNIPDVFFLSYNEKLQNLITVDSILVRALFDELISNVAHLVAFRLRKRNTTL